MALAEREGSSGRELLEAYLVGLEVHSRLGLVEAGNWDSSDDWLPIGTLGLLGAAAAAARLLGLTEPQVRAALALGGHLAGQLSCGLGTPAKAVGAGCAAWAAVQAADLARGDVTGADRILERKGGLVEVFLDGSSARFDALASLGRPHHVLEHGVAIKRYPAVYACQWPNDALRLLLESHPLDPHTISRIELRRPPAAAFCDLPRPLTVEEARSSFEFNLAAIALTGDAGLDAFNEERLGDREQIAMQERIAVMDHPAGTPLQDSWRYVVTLYTKSGDVLDNWVRHPSGHPKRPMTGDEMHTKVLSCTDGLLEPAAVAELESLVSELVDQPDLRRLFELVRCAFA
jgi:2-methylcitrate dehydratase PrpD